MRWDATIDDVLNDDDYDGDDDNDNQREWRQQLTTIYYIKMSFLF